MKKAWTVEMKKAWTVGAVGPDQRAIMCDGKVRAVAENEPDANRIVMNLNAYAGEIGARLALSAFRFKVAELRDEIEKYEDKDVAAVDSDVLRTQLNRILDSIGVPAEVSESSTDPSGQVITLGIEPLGIAGLFASKMNVRIPLDGTTIVIPMMGQEFGVSARGAAAP